MKGMSPWAAKGVRQEQSNSAMRAMLQWAVKEAGIPPNAAPLLLKTMNPTDGIFKGLKEIFCNAFF
jgi:hypothetical protein